MDEIILTKQDYARAAQIEDEIANELGENNPHPDGRAIHYACRFRAEILRNLANKSVS